MKACHGIQLSARLKHLNPRMSRPDGISVLRPVRHSVSLHAGTQSAS